MAPRRHNVQDDWSFVCHCGSPKFIGQSGQMGRLTHWYLMLLLIEKGVENVRRKKGNVRR